jgi:hypothetical protein
VEGLLDTDLINSVEQYLADRQGNRRAIIHLPLLGKIMGPVSDEESKKPLDFTL